MTRLLPFLGFLGASPALLAAQQPDSLPVGHFTDFGLRLLHGIVATNPSPNTFISPFSAGLAYAAVLPGADGTTSTEIKATLGVASLPENALLAQLRQLQDRLTRSSDVTVHIGTSLWVQNGLPLRPEYQAAVDQGFASDTRQVDFASPVVVEQVNAWVKQATSGRIPTILSEPPGPVVLMLLNAVYFKGDWLDRFDSTLTKPDTFATSSHRKVIVPFMQSRRHVRYWATDSLQGLLLPYRGGNLSALLVLPSGSHSPSSLLPALSASRLATWRQTRLVTDIILRFPRLELRGEYDLKTPLISLGLRQAFDNRSANFGRLSPRPLFISASRQVTFLKVSEQGTEAAAVTSNSFQIRSAPRPPVPVTFNRPFLFGIVDNASGELLLIGQVGDPSANPD